jgi:uridine kinase
MQRAEVIEAVAATVQAVRLDHPTRVAVEGVTASGKTTFARELVAGLHAAGRPATHLTMDGFHHPAAHRRRQGRLSGDGYYEDAYDFGAFVEKVLDPLGPGGDRRYRTAVVDLAFDQAVDQPPVEAAPDEVVVVDGSFLGRPEVGDRWDLRIWLEVPFAVAQARGVARDKDLLGGADAAAHAFEQRYHAAFRRYLAECDPRSSADLIIDNTDPHAPTMLRP